MFTNNKSPLVLAIVLYILIYFLRLSQIAPIERSTQKKIDLFPNLRQNLDYRISSFLPTPQAELLSGIILGNKTDLPYDLRLALRDTSTLHIVVVSGQNLTLLAGFLLGLSGLIKRKIAIFLSIGAILSYTILTGGEIPVIRAAIMAVLSFTAQILGRERDGVWVLIATAGLMLLVNPAWLFDLSFQLSFLATMGVIVVAPIIQRLIVSLPEFIKLDLAVTVGAQFMVMPIIIQNFHQLSYVSVFANLMVGWTIPFIMILGTIMIAVSLLSTVLSSVLAFLASIMLTYFIYIVKFFASLPFAWEYAGEQIWIVWVGYYLILAGILLALSKTRD